MIVEVDYTHRVYAKIEVPDRFMRATQEELEDFICENGDNLKKVEIYIEEFELEELGRNL